jgi:hypothetical protein
MRVTNPTTDLDAQTMTYVFAAQRPFEDLRQALGQVSGWLVLAALHMAEAAGDHPALAGAGSLVRDSLDDLRDMRATARAQTHHACLLRAAGTLAAVVSDARTRTRVRTDAQIERWSHEVHTAYADVARAAGALPGFEMVSFAHACCARQVGA